MTKLQECFIIYTHKYGAGAKCIYSRDMFVLHVYVNTYKPGILQRKTKKGLFAYLFWLHYEK